MDGLLAPGDPRSMSDDLLGYDDAARVLSVSPRTVRRLVRERRLDAVRVGGSVRLRRGTLVEYAARQTPTGRGAAPGVETRKAG